MEINQISKTADAAAAMRASHYLYDEPLIFDDPHAIDLTSMGWRVVCRSRFLHWLVMRKYMAGLKPVFAQTLSRASYSEDCLRKAVAKGIRQYGILSAGLDSFAIRRSSLVSVLNISEFDHPATQLVKKKRLKNLGIELPQSLEFVPVDFERETLTSALRRSSILRVSPVFFSWLGTIPYLSESAIINTFQQIYDFSSEGSQIVFDYAVPDSLIDMEGREMIAKLRKFTDRRGEPLVSFLDPGLFYQRLEKIGYKVLENLSPADQNKRYFSGRTDGYQALPSTNFVLLEK